MENKSYSTISNLLLNNNTSSSSSSTTTITSSSTNTFVLSPSTNTSTTTTPPITSSLQTLQTFLSSQSVKVFPENNNRTNRILTQPVFNKLSSEIIKQEQIENDSEHVQYSIAHPPIDNSAVHLKSLEPIPMSNTNSHLLSSHLSNGTGSFFAPNVSNDLTSNYKLPASTNSDLPSPSNSSNSSNPPTSTNNQIKRHGDGPDTTRKREVRLQKNREAARECRRKKKEYIKCLEERVTSLEDQNKALIEELRQLKELYCQREDSNSKSTSKR